jgi:NADH-quinone oxidoreductase subunit J
VSAVLFFIAAIGAIAGAIGVVLLRDPFYSVLSLVAHLLSLATLFLLLRSEFVAAVQVVVYAGAVMVLYVFVVAYVGDQEPLGSRLRGGGPLGSGLRVAAGAFGLALVVELFIALLGTGLKAVGSNGAGYNPHPAAGQPVFGTPAYIGNLLLTKFLLVFEVASMLLLIAAVGAVVLARRRGGIDESGDDLTPPQEPLPLLRPRGTGTMAEATTGLAFAAAHDRGEEFQSDELTAGDEPGAGDPAPAPAGSRGEGGW